MCGLSVGSVVTTPTPDATGVEAPPVLGLYFYRALSPFQPLRIASYPYNSPALLGRELRPQVRSLAPNLKASFQQVLDMTHLLDSAIPPMPHTRLPTKTISKEQGCQ